MFLLRRGAVNFFLRVYITKRSSSKVSEVLVTLCVTGWDTLREKKIGNLISDNAENLQSINWTVYGKIKSITKPASAIYYGYDAAGNRVHKKVTGSNTNEEIYVRDAQGNTLAVYRLQGDSTFWKEQHLYGSSRLGIYQYQGILPAAPVVTNGTVTTLSDSLLMGNTSYELSNHLGNVLAVITDKKIGVSSLADSSLTDHYVTDVLSLQDYYSFGSQMVGRSYQANKYRYGFNGQEKSKEINENSFTAEFWQYDARLGRRWNLDPKPNVGISSYSVFANNPIFYSDPLGDTIVTGAGGTHSIDIDEKQNSLEYYNSNTTYSISGTKTQVPVQAGQLRSFSNVLGKFSARWTTGANGTTAFAGYKNDKGQDLGTAVQELNEFTSSWKYKLWSLGSHIQREHDKDPLGFNLKLTTTLLIISATAAVEPVGYSPGYNPSVTLSEGSAEFGFAYRAINPAFVKSTTQNGFYMSGAPGRLGNDGIYVNSTIRGAIKEFQFHNPRVNPAIFEVRYPLSKPLLINPPARYFSQPLPFTQGVNILSAPSLRVPGTTNLLIRAGAKVGERIQ